MNILIVTPIFPPEIGGPATYVYELSQRLKKKHKITVVTFAEKVKKLEGCKVILVRLKYNFLGTVRRQFALFKTIAKNIKQTDIIYAQGPYVVGLVSLLVAKIFQKKIIIKFVGDLVWETAFGNRKTEKTLDNFLSDSKKSLKDKIKIKVQKYVFHKTDKVIVPSKYLKNVLTKYYKVKDEKVEIIYNSIDEKVLHAVKKSKEHIYQKIITIGRLVKWKHIDGVIEAFYLLKDKKNVKLKIIGEGPEQEAIQSLIQNLKLENSVECLGKLSMKETLQELINADLFILNSSYEGLPHTVIESMFLKVPVIATNIPGTQELAQNEKTALTVEVQNPKDLASKIEQILSDNQLKEKLRNKAYKYVKEKCTWETNMKKLEKVFQSIHTMIT
ncbi:glycosyltransferase family 4 protein [Candidatus Peregrinibacteria bacterium]|nr:glycosyltransferase family 4 protein [Candidatus Peregrinibacteria bacterium]